MLDFAATSYKQRPQLWVSGPETPVSHDDREWLSHVVNRVEAIVPPLWPLRDYVAVNPFQGLSRLKFLEARQTLVDSRDCELLPTLEYWRENRNRVSVDDLAEAWSQCSEEYPEVFADESLDRVVSWFETGCPDCPADNTARRYSTVAESIDRDEKTHWSATVIDDIARHCANHFDEGQSSWDAPWKGDSLYAAWRQTMQFDQRFEREGVRHFRSFVSGLPDQPGEAIAYLLKSLGVPSEHWQPWLLCQIGSIWGWASYVKYRVRSAEQQGGRDEDLVGLLAIRLAYDVALAETRADRPKCELWPGPWPAPGAANALDDVNLLIPQEVSLRYLLQVAAEIAYRRRILSDLSQHKDLQAPVETASRLTAQMVFCIDVRSEVIRRHIESLTDQVETFGFAGFFGLPLQHVEAGADSGKAHCPVLLQPEFTVHEPVPGGTEHERSQQLTRIRTRRLRSRIWKSFQTSSASCFSFVESLGFTYVLQLLRDSVGLGGTGRSASRQPAAEQSSVRPDVQGTEFRLSETAGISEQRELELACGILHNLGLEQDFARLVVLCGHASQVKNNPYQSGYDCGACGGHSGEPNARVAAGLLNSPTIRRQLRERGIEIPDDTVFVPAVHVTTTDEIRLLDTDRLAASHAADLHQLQQWLAEAGRLTRTERAGRLKADSEQSVSLRSNDWSEVRPEWGLANNAAFIVAPRQRTRGLTMDGRTFLHSYDHHKDPDFKVLELIMTAPMVVTNWINLQYYASAVDNRAFGSGNKAIHNVVGKLGVQLGSGGDLQTGLPWQGVHDGTMFQHEPLRLLVVIEAPLTAVKDILERHADIRALVTNGWLNLMVIDGERSYRWNSCREWVEQLAGNGQPFVMPNGNEVKVEQETC